VRPRPDGGDFVLVTVGRLIEGKARVPHPMHETDAPAQRERQGCWSSAEGDG
jgi:hypothetical protein